MKETKGWRIGVRQGDKIETLADTTDLMVSKNYKDRFKAEYYQLKIRFVKLGTMVKNWEEGKLDFTPTCSKVIYERQLNAMADYILVLEKRAKIEGIELN